MPETLANSSTVPLKIQAANRAARNADRIIREKDMTVFFAECSHFRKSAEKSIKGIAKGTLISDMVMDKPLSSGSPGMFPHTIPMAYASRMGLSV
jgi:hypothetical protein